MAAIAVAVIIGVTGVAVVNLTRGSGHQTTVHVGPSPSAAAFPSTHSPSAVPAPPPVPATTAGAPPTLDASPTPGSSEPVDLSPGPGKVPQANAVTDSDWAWPGLRYDVLKDNSWYSCSVGLPTWDNAGTRYFISAGHCFRDESGNHIEQPGGAGLNVYTPSDHQTPVGFERTYTLPSNNMYNDVSLVEMYPGKKLDGTGWQHIPDTPVAAAVGDQACLVGLNHDKSNCGLVTATESHEKTIGYPWMEVLTDASYCAYPGDSGGAVYNSSGALGIETTANIKQNAPGTPGACSSTFFPVGRILWILRQDNPSLTI
jgi:hypothetical protein